MLRGGINGFGTIGKRVADAVRVQPDMTVAGVAKRSPSFEATIAVDRGHDLYAAGEDGSEPFGAAGLHTAGTVRDMVGASDVVPENIDAVRALSERTASAEQSVRRTDEALGVGQGLVQHESTPARAEGTADD